MKNKLTKNATKTNPRPKNTLPKLKLYVWRGVFTDYTDGIAFALAESEGQARELVAAESDYPDRVKEELCSAPAVFSVPHGEHIHGGG